MQDIFPRNLSAFRRRAGYTQEGLAEALGVSRQAVGKWESGQALPEAATLLTLADLLNCSLDALMREPLAEEGLLPASSAEDPRQRTYDAYHAHVGTFARSVALGVFLLLMGISLTALTAALAAAEAASTVVFFLFLAAAVFLFITAGMADDDFRKNHPDIPLLFDREEHLAFQRKSRTVVALSVVGLLSDLALCAVMATLSGGEKWDMYMGVVFMALMALCVTPLVYRGCLSRRYEPEVYAPGARDLSGPIMLLAAAGFLIWGLVWDGWQICWVCFLIGAALSALAKQLQKR